MKSQILTRNSGFSIIEGLIASAIVASTVMGITVLTYLSTNNNGVMSAQSCREIARSSLNRIEALGTRPTIDNYVVSKNDPVGSPTSTSGSHLFGISPSSRWPGTAPFTILDKTSAPAAVRNSDLINGSIVALQTIYNSNISFCTSTTGQPITDTTTESLFLTNLQVATKDIQTSIRIQPYQIDTGKVAPDAFACPAPPLLIRPSALTPTPPYEGTAYKFPDESHSELGFMATVFVSYTDTHGVAQSCNVSEPFFYPRDDKAPIAPQVSISNNIPATPCFAGTNQITVKMYYDGSPGHVMEPGTIFSCRDNSSITGNGGGGTTCTKGGVTLLPNQTFSSPWGPCDATPVCGVAPASTSATSDAYGTVYTMVYNNVPYNCNAEMDILSIDVSGNSTFYAASASTQKPGCNGCWNGNTYCPPYSCPPPPTPPTPPGPPCYSCPGGGK